MEDRTREEELTQHLEGQREGGKRTGQGRTFRAVGV